MQSNYSNVFAMRLRLARKARNLSQERLGILAGIDESSASARMNQYEKGKHTPDFLMASQIASVLDVPAAYFYIEDDQLAEIIKQSYLLGSEQKEKILSYIKSLK